MKAFFANLWAKIGVFVVAVLGFFSYSYYQKTREQRDRVKENNREQSDINKELKDNVEELHAAQHNLEEAVAKVDEIKLVEPKPTDTLEDSVADWNKPKG